MNKKLFSLISLVLVFSMLFAFAGCSFTGAGEGEEETTIHKRTSDLPTEQLYKVSGDGVTHYLDAEGNELENTTVLDEAGIEAKNTRLVEYYNINVNKLVDGSTTAVVTRNEGKSLGRQSDADGNSVAYSENSYVNAAIDSLKKYMLVTRDTETSEYTNDLNDVLPGAPYVSSLTFNDVESATCVDGDTTRKVVITLKSPVSEAVIDANFDKEDIDAVYAEFDKASDYMEIDKSATKLEYVNCVIEVVTDLETDEVLSIKYIKGINVNTVVTGKGKLESAGEVPVCFLYTYTVEYNIDRTNPEEAE
ncbi:MAG: hypothetical protein IKH13_06220 [Clostridia bacterium]|nr:hypothetical protein [Clostridia bacterium]